MNSYGTCEEQNWLAWPHLLAIYRWRTKREWNHTYEKSMMNFLVYYIGKQDVEDLAQETFVWAFVKQRGRQPAGT